MILSKKKKLQRDRDAGLVFCWRGSHGGNRGGLIIALLMASGLFGLAFFGVSLDLKVAKPESRQSAKILLLDSISSEMALWIDQNSPFPSRWDPQYDDEHQNRIHGALGSLYQGITIPPSPWREVPTGWGAQVETPRLITSGEVDLGRLPEVEKPQAKQSVLELIVTMEGDGALRERVPTQLKGFSTKIPQQAYGVTRRFALGLKPDGELLMCAPVEWDADPFDRELEAWVRSQEYASSKGSAVQLGEISVTVEVKAHVGD